MDRFKIISRLLAVVVLGGAFIIINYSFENQTKDNWYVFNPENDFSKTSIISRQDLLDAPAGKHGFVLQKGKDLTFEDGTPVKFWGVNICDEKPFTNKKNVAQYVDMLSFMGVNGVRFHKFTWKATDSINSTLPDSVKFSKMDFFQWKLKERGIYYGWSHIYGHKVRPGDSSRLMAYEEVAHLKYPWRHLNGTSSSLVNFAPDLQELNIELTVNMLNRINPYTGLRYADDPALSFVEMQNEDDIFWSAIETALEQAPTYKAYLCKLFSKWLQKKYITEERLKMVWGADLPNDQSLKESNIYPMPNHGVFSSAYFKSLKNGRAIQKSMLDKMQFLYETQSAFYSRFEKAIRATGYKGVIITSNWQAGSGISHLYNLYSDYEIGPIDRHNYFGGSGGHRLDTGIVKNTSMLSKPGSGLLGTGMQQVADSPFFISEWMSLIPNEYTAEASPIVATYGMGLQGWDASYSFAVGIPQYSKKIQSHSGGIYNVTSPLQMGLYPALTTMIYRQDVTESPIISERNVHIPSLEKGKIGFIEKVKQGYDDKSFEGTIPPEMLAYGKIPITFTENYIETRNPPENFIKEESKEIIISTTKELRWDFSEKGYFSINTKGTKAIVGFAKEKDIQLNKWTIRPENDFSVIYLTSLDPNLGLEHAKRILITAIGRARNTDMKYSDDGTQLLELGTSPIEMEAMNFTITSPRENLPILKVLDHMGRYTGTEIQLKNKTFKIEGKRYKTLYYLLEY